MKQGREKRKERIPAIYHLARCADGLYGGGLRLVMYALGGIGVWWAMRSLHE